MTTFRCPICYGAKTFTYLALDSPNKTGILSGKDMIPITITCEVCKGTGEVDESVRAEIENFRQTGKIDWQKIMTENKGDSE